MNGMMRSLAAPFTFADGADAAPVGPMPPPWEASATFSFTPTGCPRAVADGVQEAGDRQAAVAPPLEAPASPA